MSKFDWKQVEYRQGVKEISRSQIPDDALDDLRLYYEVRYARSQYSYAARVLLAQLQEKFSVRFHLIVRNQNTRTINTFRTIEQVKTAQRLVEREKRKENAIRTFTESRKKYTRPS